MVKILIASPGIREFKLAKPSDLRFEFVGSKAPELREAGSFVGA